jgi:monoterpene epsilon-lactone hydrolase
VTNDPELQQLLQMLREGGPDLSAPPPVARENFEQMMAGMPVAEDIEFTPTELGGLPALQTQIRGATAKGNLLYLHGGAFVVGSAQAYRNLAAELARATGARGWALDYRLAPEHPFPAAVDDGVAAYKDLLQRGCKPAEIVIAGDSAGGGLAISVLVAARDAGLPMPAAALAISPWTDLGCDGASMQSKAEEDPSLTRDGLLAMAGLYLSGRPASSPLASPIHAKLEGLPPLLIQVGSSEILLSDAIRLAGAAASAGVDVTLRTWPHMVHVWHAFGFMLGAGRRATREAGDYLARHMEQAT